MRINLDEIPNYDMVLRLVSLEVSSLKHPQNDTTLSYDKAELKEIGQAISSCRCKYIAIDENYDESGSVFLAPTIAIVAPLSAFRILEGNAERYVEEAFAVVFRRYITSNKIKNSRMSFVEDLSFVKFLLDDNWLDELKPDAVNQNVSGKGEFDYEGLKFNSPGEVAIAQELDRRGIIYFPNCVARVGKPNDRGRTEPDFLIFHQGKWGVLEVSGRTYHFSGVGIGKRNGIPSIRM